MSETEQSSSKPQLIEDLSHKGPIEGAHEISIAAEIPIKKGCLYLDPGHTPFLPVELFKPEELYFQDFTSHNAEGTKSYHVYALPEANNIINNPLFKENQEIDTPYQAISNLGEKTKIRDLLFWSINQQLPNDDPSSDLVNLQHYKRKQKEIKSPQLQTRIDTLSNSIETTFTRYYYQAEAVQQILEASTDSPSEFRSQLQEKVDSVLGNKDQTFEDRLATIKQKRDDILKTA